MTIAPSIFSTVPPVVPPISAIQVRIGDDISIPFAVVDTLGNAINCSGATFGAIVYDQFSGQFTASVQLTNVSGGLGNAVISSAITSALTPQTAFAPICYVRLSVWMIDTAGHRHTFDPLGLLALRPQDFADVAIQPALKTLVIQGTQGPAGVSNLLSGSGPPAPTLGAQGSWYIDLNALGFWINTGGTWTLIGSLVPTTDPILGTELLHDL